MLDDKTTFLKIEVREDRETNMVNAHFGSGEKRVLMASINASIARNDQKFMDDFVKMVKGALQRSLEEMGLHPSSFSIVKPGEVN